MSAISTILAGSVPMVDGKPATEVVDGVSARQLFGDKNRRSGVTFDDLIILPGEDEEGSTSAGRPISDLYYSQDRKLAFMDNHGIDISVLR